MEYPDIEDLLLSLNQSNLSLESEEEEELIMATPPHNIDYPSEVSVVFGCGQLEERVESTRQRIETEFGITDDVIILGGDRYYYFKIPHKVR